MLIDEENIRVQYDSTAKSPIMEGDPLPFPFKYIEKEQIKAILLDGTELVFDEDYTVGYPEEEKPEGEDEASVSADTTVVIMKIDIPVGETITLYRETALDQTSEFPQEARFSSRKIEDALDKLTMQNQEQREALARALKLPLTAPIDVTDLALPNPEPNKSVKWNAEGTALVNTNFDPDTALATTENFKNQAQQSAKDSANSASASANSATVAGQKVNEITALHSEYMDDINTTSTNYLNQINSRGSTIIKDADAIIHRVGLNMFDLVLKDHLLSYPNDRGLALQGTWVYRDAVAGSRYGYPDFYNTCLEEYNNATSTTLKLATNVTKYGRITESNGVISNFTHACNYAAMKVKRPTKSFELVVKAKTPATLSSNSVIQANEQHKGLIIRAISTTSTKCWLSSNGTSWNICDGFETNLDLPANTNVWLRIKWTGTEYTFEMSTDNKTWTKGASKASNLPIYWDTGLQGLGGCHWEAYAWVGGSIDLNNSYLDIDGARYWDGTIKMSCKKHSNGHIFYHIDQKTKVDAAYNVTKSAWFYGIDPDNYRIFLPRHDWFEQLTTNTGEINKVVEAGIPNITGFFPTELHGSGQSFTGGAIYNPGQTLSGGAGEGTDWRTNLDASRQSFVFGNSPTVQPPAIKRLAYICVGNQVQDTSWVDVVTQVENGIKDLEHQTQQGLDALKQAANSVTYNNITNCFTKIPKRLKFNLTNGVLTLKATSEFFVPTPSGWITKVVSIDTTFNSTLSAGDFLVFDNGEASTNSLRPCKLDSIYAGGVEPTSPYNGLCWYDTKNSQIVVRQNNVWTGQRSIPLARIKVDSTGKITDLCVFDSVVPIASTWLILPGVEYLLSYGQNIDGTIQNSAEKVPYIRGINMLASGRMLILRPNGQLESIIKGNYFESETQPKYSATSSNLWYNPKTKETRRYNGSEWYLYPAMPVAWDVKTTDTSGILQDFGFYQTTPFEGVNFNTLSRTTTTFCAPDYSKMITVATATKPDGNFTAPAHGYMIFDIVLWSDAGHITVNGQDICRRIHGSDYMTDYSLTVPVAKGDYITFYSVYNDTAGYTSHTVKFVPMKGAQ